MIAGSDGVERAVIRADRVFLAGMCGNCTTYDRFVLGLLGEQFKLLKSATPGADAGRPVAQFERTLIEETLRRHRGNAAAAATRSGFETFYDKLQRLKLRRDFR
jgi:DNA-binding NtrC family response regulator